jgi:hypothetical protein
VKLANLDDWMKTLLDLHMLLQKAAEIARNDELEGMGLKRLLFDQWVSAGSQNSDLRQVSKIHWAQPGAILPRSSSLSGTPLDARYR